MFLASTLLVFFIALVVKVFRMCFPKELEDEQLQQDEEIQDCFDDEEEEVQV